MRPLLHGNELLLSPADADKKVLFSLEKLAFGQDEPIAELVMMLKSTVGSADENVTASAWGTLRKGRIRSKTSRGLRCFFNLP